MEKPVILGDENIVELVDLACELAQSLQTDVEDDPDSVSNPTMVVLQKFLVSLDKLNNSLDVTSGLQ